MKTDQRQAGVAIVVVLSFIVLMSVAILAFIARSTTEQHVANSSVNQSKADLLAKSACDNIVADLRDEMFISSTSSVVNGFAVLIPKTNKDVVPSKTMVTTTGTAPNLVKFSKSGTPFYTVTSGATSGTMGMASPASTGSSSLNGRSISPERWNRSYLLPRISGTAISCTPDPAFFSAPDWVIVTRSGPAFETSLGSGTAALNNPALSNSNYAIGRYAYMIYDEGGLLDINAAGAPSVLPQPGGTNVQQITYGHKGGLAFADLANLTGTSGNKLLTSTDIDHIIGWRNYASSRVSGSFGSYIFDVTSSGNYYNYVLGNTGGGLTSGSAVWNGLTDQKFLSRQQLIQFSRGMNGAASGFNVDALQYLGTFSREKNAPSYVQPSNDPNRPNIDQNVNPDILQVRFSSDKTLTRYRADGSTYQVNVKKGAPLVQMRFPLNRIAWFTPDGPNPDIPNAAAAIKQHFGLVWDTSATEPNYRWIYTSPDAASGSLTPASTIKTLSSVATVNREPDFFELLKAGILVGSLGKTCSDPTQPSKDTQGSHSGYDDVNSDIQVLRIGANIIDQFTPDSIPVAIRVTNSQNTLAEDVYGVESVPYISRILRTIYRPVVTGATVPVNPGTDPTRAFVGGWYGFSMWDPHQNANVSLGSGLPSNFKIRPIPGASGNMGGVFLHLLASGSVGTQSFSKTYDAPVVTLNSADSITYQRSASASFVEPTMLSPTGGGGSASSSGSNNVVSITGTSGFVGFNVAWSATDSVLVTDTSTPPISAYLHFNGYAFSLTASGLPSFEVQCVDPNTGKWHAYQQVKDTLSAGTAGCGETSGSTAFMKPETATQFFNADPRSMRFGGCNNHDPKDLSNPQASGILSQGNGNLSLWPNLGAPNGGEWGQTGRTGVGWYIYDSGTGSPVQVTATVPANFDRTIPLLCYNYPDGTGAINRIINKTIAIWYKDPDGVIRPGDAVNSGTVSGLNPMRPCTTGTNPDPERPVVLNRPARSVGELGYAGRDMPWKTLDFWSAYSADANLLDLFTVTEGDVVAGKVSLNTRNATVLATLLSGVQPAVEVPQGKENVPTVGTANSIITTGTVSWADALTIAKSIVARTSGTNFKNPADLVNEFATNTAYGTVGSFNSNVKAQREAPLRALVDSVSTRTWNLMIDVIAQTGRYAISANSSTPLDQFIVEGERRFWVHVAIDRFTGEIVDQQWEVVND